MHNPFGKYLDPSVGQDQGHFNERENSSHHPNPLPSNTANFVPIETHFRVDHRPSASRESETWSLIIHD